MAGRALCPLADAGTDLMLALVLKLNEAQLRPLWFKLLEWEQAGSGAGAASRNVITHAFVHVHRSSSSAGGSLPTFAT